MRPTDIKAEIRRRGTSQAAIAAYLGLTTTSVSRVVNGKQRSWRVEQELAKILGQNPFGEKAKKGPKKTVWNGGVGL